MKLPRLHLFAACVFVVTFSRATTFDDRVEALFRPLIGEMMALSPDGERVAYTSQADGKLAIVIMNVENPGRKRTVPVEPGRDAAGGPEPSAAQLRFLRWATADRLVYAPVERIVPLPPLTDQNGRSIPNPDGPTIHSPILTTDADGRQRGTVIDARDFQETPAGARRSLADLLRMPQELQATRKEPIHWRMPHLDILGFLPRNREQLIVGTRGAYSMPMQHLVDLRTGGVRDFGEEWPAPPGAPQVFDWFRHRVVGERRDGMQPATHWLDEDLARVQRDLAAKFPRRIVEILDWSDTHARVLFRVTGGRDSGRVFVFQRVEDLAVEILHRAPWLSAATLNATRWFEFDSADGARLSGYATWPGKPRADPPPLLVIFPAEFPGRAQPAFDPEAQVFADLGFAVVRLNHRSVASAGTKGTIARRAAVDSVSVEDAQAVIRWLAARNPASPFDRQRVAALGRGFGGQLALRALQRQPAVFRCGIALDAPPAAEPGRREEEAGDVAAPPTGRMLPALLIRHEGADWKTLPVFDRAEARSNPVRQHVLPARSPMADAVPDDMRVRLPAPAASSDLLTLEPGSSTAQPETRADVYRKIEEFLNRQLQDDDAKGGPEKEAP